MKLGVYETDIINTFNKYNMPKEDRDIFLNIIKPIFIHDEFQRRLNSKEFPHHDQVSLGYHIISDAVISYILAKKAKLKQKYKDMNLNIPVLIAMFHDLYELPWQNAHPQKKMFVNKHGFIHPIEAAINSNIWYPEYFKNSKDAEIIIDGIIHHMYPFPVRAIDDDIYNLDLNNSDAYLKLNESIKKLIVKSTKLGYIEPLHISLHKSKYKEGQIMSKADKIVAICKEGSFKEFVSCITGSNSNLDNYQRR